MTNDQFVEIKRGDRLFVLDKRMSLVFPNSLNAWLVARSWRKRGMQVAQKGRHIWFFESMPIHAKRLLNAAYGKQAPAFALNVPCPTCGAKPDETCAW